MRREYIIVEEIDEDDRRRGKAPFQREEGGGTNIVSLLVTNGGRPLRSESEMHDRIYARPIWKAGSAIVIRRRDVDRNTLNRRSPPSPARRLESRDSRAAHTNYFTDIDIFAGPRDAPSTPSPDSFPIMNILTLRAIGRDTNE